MSYIDNISSNETEAIPSQIPLYQISFWNIYIASRMTSKQDVEDYNTLLQNFSNSINNFDESDETSFKDVDLQAWWESTCIAPIPAEITNESSEKVYFWLIYGRWYESQANYDDFSNKIISFTEDNPNFDGSIDYASEEWQNRFNSYIRQTINTEEAFQTINSEENRTISALQDFLQSSYLLKANTDLQNGLTELRDYATLTSSTLDNLSDLITLYNNKDEPTITPDADDPNYTSSINSNLTDDDVATLISLREAIASRKEEYDNAGQKDGANKQLAQLLSTMEGLSTKDNWITWQGSDNVAQILRSSTSTISGINNIITASFRKQLYVLDEFYKSAIDFAKTLHNLLRTNARNFNS